MSQTEQIEIAIRDLPDHEKKALVLRLSDVYCDAWDDQLEKDFASGALDSIIVEAEADIAAGRTKPLDEFLRDQ